MDVYFSSSHQTFVINVDEIGRHRVDLDKELINRQWTDENGNPLTHSRQRRSVRNTSSEQTYHLFELPSGHFHTYQTIEETNTILKFRKIESRLVITLPLELHDLKTSRFYLILYGVGNQLSNESFGYIYFRQDQPHIDLFVFFSVFFSSFFLFLAKCVLLWKLKQAIDTQRNRQRQQKEMAHMASRPFAKVLVLIEPEQAIFSSTPLPRRRTKLPKLNNPRNPVMTLTPVESFLPPPIPNLTSYNVNKVFCPFDVVPIATEPMDNTVAALRTVVLQLPGGNSAPSKLCLGTALTFNSRSNNTNTKNGARQRSNHSTCWCYICICTRILYYSHTRMCYLDFTYLVDVMCMYWIWVLCRNVPEMIVKDKSECIKSYIPLSRYKDNDIAIPYIGNFLSGFNFRWVRDLPEIVKNRPREK